LYLWATARGILYGHFFRILAGHLRYLLFINTKIIVDLYKTPAFWNRRNFDQYLNYTKRHPRESIRSRKNARLLKCGIKNIWSTQLYQLLPNRIIDLMVMRRTINFQHLPLPNPFEPFLWYYPCVALLYMYLFTYRTTFSHSLIFRNGSKTSSQRGERFNGFAHQLVPKRITRMIVRIQDLIYLLSEPNTAMKPMALRLTNPGHPS